MSGPISGSWSMSGDPCPRCGNLETYIWSFFELRRLGIRLRSRKSRRGKIPQYKIECRSCGLVEIKRGLPGRELAE
jgi:hypothetical protein